MGTGTKLLTHCRGFWKRSTWCHLNWVRLAQAGALDSVWMWWILSFNCRSRRPVPNLWLLSPLLSCCLSLAAQRWSFSPCRLCLASPAAQKQLSEDTSVLCPCSPGLSSRHSLPPPSSSLGSARRCSARAPRQSAPSPLSWSLLRKQRFTIIC